MLLGYLLFLITARPRWVEAIAIAVALGGSALWIASQPVPSSEKTGK